MFLKVTCDGSSRKRRSVDPENTVTTTFQVKVENAVISGLTGIIVFFLLSPLYIFIIFT